MAITTSFAIAAVRRGEGETTEETRIEEKQKQFLCPLSWTVQHNLARDGYIESTWYEDQERFFCMGTKIIFPC
jgi:hypothetical protein